MNKNAPFVIGGVLGLHAAAFGYLALKEFELREFKFAQEDFIVDIDIPPPPPPPPPPDLEPPPPPPEIEIPRFQPRPAQNVAATAPSLPVPPVEEPIKAPPTAAVAPPPPPAAPAGPRTIQSKNVKWKRKPQSSDFADNYPERAQRLEKEGTSTIACIVNERGKLTECQVVEEDPAGYGFGQAHITAMKRLEAEPQQLNGEPVAGGRLTLKVRWTLPEE